MTRNLVVVLFLAAACVMLIAGCASSPGAGLESRVHVIPRFLTPHGASALGLSVDRELFDLEQRILEGEASGARR